MPDSEFDQSNDARWRRYQDLLLRFAQWDRLSHGARSKFVRDLESLFSDSKKWDEEAVMGAVCATGNTETLALINTIWSLVASVYLKCNKRSSAIDLFVKVFDREPNRGDTFENLLRALLADGQFARAAELVNNVSPNIYDEEEGSNAAQVVEWSMRHEQFAVNIRDECLKECIRRVSKFSHRQEVSVRINPLPERILPDSQNFVD